MLMAQILHTLDLPAYLRQNEGYFWQFPVLLIALGQ